MAKRNITKYLCSLLVFLLLPLSSCSFSFARNYHVLPPKYLVNLAEGGVPIEDNDYKNFIFYPIDGIPTGPEDNPPETEYAIGLSETGLNRTGEIEIPASYNDIPITAIWHDGFRKSKATSIKWNSSIKIIDFEAFLNSSLTSVSIPDSVIEIGEAAFYVCRSLNSAYFGIADGGADTCDVTTSVGLASPKVKTIPSFCFFGCLNMTTLVLPDSLTTIEPEAFGGCRNISSPLLMPNIKTIRSRAFDSCISLAKVSVGQAMFNQDEPCPGIEPHAFENCGEIAFTFYGDSAKLTAWETNHSSWGVHGGESAYTYTKAGDAYPASTTIWNTMDFPTSGSGKVKITGYKGPVPENYLAIPNVINGKTVVKIDREALPDATKAAVKRIYLPTTLLSIENYMFDTRYTNLTIIDDIGSMIYEEVPQNKCTLDLSGKLTNGRINLSGILNLEFIGDLAFVGLPNFASIKSVHLPAKLIAVGSSVFGYDQVRHFYGIREFKWDYIEGESRLECIGGDAFVKFGYNSSTMGNGEYKEDDKYSDDYGELTTLIFPSSFRHFGITSGDITKFKDNHPENPFTFGKKQVEKADIATLISNKATSRRADRQAHCFAGCRCLRKVIFKGGSESQTEDLIVPLQTFVANANLQTIVFEERENHEISFHTQYQNFFSQQSIGSSGGDGAGLIDFRSTPMLQTLVLPNHETTIRVQDFAFFGNARAAIYLSDSLSENFKYNKQTDGTNGNWMVWADDKSKIGDDSETDNLLLWRKVGDEKYFNIGNRKGKRGYCFASSTGDNTDPRSGSVNTFDINQDIPYYENVHYKETLKDANGNDVIVEVGKNNPNEYVEKEKCAYLCYETTVDEKTVYEATMTNYLYDMHNGDSSTAVVQKTITLNEKNYTVKIIGGSAFSACYSDGKDGFTFSEGKDLTTVILPDTIEEIKEYAFLRAYNLKNIATGTKKSHELGTVPSSLKKIGKGAFSFCEIKEIRKIPYDCVFYENENDVDTISLFTNNFSLRRISFLDESKEEETDDSAYYEATTYTHGSGGSKETRTCALYSKDSASGLFQRNLNKLLLVLYRDNADYEKTSDDYTGSPYPTFDGNYKPGVFLYGAYKMGTWIKQLNLGAAPGSGTYQPLFSPICQRKTNGDIIQKPIYLNNPAEQYDSNEEDHECELTTISATNFLTLPKYAFNGCEKISKVILPTSGVAIQEGLFANNKDAEVKYYVSGQTEPDSSCVDLTGSQIKTISKDAFKNNKKIEKFVAATSTGGNYTISPNAFSGCESLEEIDFSAIKGGTLIIDSNAFNGCKNLKLIKWPADNVTVNFKGTGIFQDCFQTDPPVSVQLPAKINNGSLPESLFNNCTKISGITFKDPTAIISIGKTAFYKCSSLNSFDFASLTSLTTIGASAFEQAGTLGEDLTMPSTLTTINANAFKSSHIKNIIFGDTSGLKLGESSFSSITTLQNAKFGSGLTFHNDTFSSASIFSGCTNLEKIKLPSSFLDAYQAKVISLGSGNVLKDFIKNDSKVELLTPTAYSGTPYAPNWRYYSGTNPRPLYYMLDSDTATAFETIYAHNTEASIGWTDVNLWVSLSATDVLLGGISTITNNDGVITITFGNGYKLTKTIATSTYEWVVAS